MMKAYQFRVWKWFMSCSILLVWFSITLGFIFDGTFSDSFIYPGGLHGHNVSAWLVSQIGMPGLGLLLLITALLFFVYLSSETINMIRKALHPNFRRKKKDTATATDDENNDTSIKPKREEKIFYTNLLTGDILPFPEFIDKALKMGCLNREELEPKGLVYIRLAGAQVEMKNNSILLFALSNIAEELFPEITEVHLWDNIFWIVKTEHDRTQLYEMCELFMSKLKDRFPGEIFAYFIYHISLETLSERSKDLKHAAMQYRNVGQFIYDVDDLIESVMDTENGEQHPSAWAVVENVKDYVHEHYAEDISRQDIESSVHLNGDYLNRIFKKATGYSLVQYIQYYRILVSKRLLAEQKCTITEAGTKVGFDTPSYFAKVFKKWTNMTPNEYYNSIDSR